MQMDNQCGEFNFERQKMSGCILSCQGEGCNGADQLTPFITTLISLTTAIYCLSS